MAILLRFFRLPARRWLRFELRSQEALRNLNALARTTHTRVAHDDTVNHLLKDLPVSGMEWLRTQAVRRLLRTRALEKFRFLDRFYLVAIDGTGYLSFHTRHCDQCLTRELPDGTTLYYHPVVEAKLICHNGMAISLATEFVENTDGAEKQECELNAFYRLMPRLRQDFPRLPLCLLLDGLYLNQNVMDVAEKHRLRYIITFKEGSLPEAYDEFKRLGLLATENRLEKIHHGIRRRYRWMNDLQHEGHTFSAFECEETGRKGEKTRFLWATNLRVHRHNVAYLSQKGGRLRQKIENEGFNTQKNRGFGLGHAFSENWNAGKCFYIALQLAHFLDQIISHSTLLGDTPANLFGSGKAFAIRLREVWRNWTIPPSRLKRLLSRRYQIRLHSY